MKINTNENSIDINCYSVTENILRMTCSKDHSSRKNSFIIQEEIYDLFSDNEKFRVDPSAEGISVHYLEDNLFKIKDIDFTKTDLVQYRLSGEKPELEKVMTVDGERTQIKNIEPYIAGTAFSVNLKLQLLGDGLFGLGQDEAGVLNKRNHKEYLYQHNMKIPMPVLISSAGYGLLFDCTSLMIFDDTEQYTDIFFDSVLDLDFYVIVGSFEEIIQGIRFLTGKATMLPKWAFGYVQSKEKYTNQEELFSVANRYRNLKVPLDVIVQDWKTWKGDLWGEKILDESRYPDPKQLHEDLRKINIHTMVSIWPNLAAGGKNHAELAEKNMLLMDYSTYDAFSEKAREVYWKQADEGLFSKGFNSWWCDSTEPFPSPDWCGEKLLPEEERYALVGGEHKKYLDPLAANFYSVVHAQGMYENQRKNYPNRRVLNLTRSGYSGIQQYGVVLWAGDTSAKWLELKREIAKGINMSLSGIPFWTVDIGAFFVGGIEARRKWCNDPNASPVWFWDGEYPEGVDNYGYRELYTRWLQFGCFLPMFRSHGTDTPREIWHFGNPGEIFYDAIEKFINLRYQLLPYIYSIAADCYFKDTTMIKSLLFDFPEDPRCVDIDNQYLFGDSLLVCPVYEEMYYNKKGEKINKEKIWSCYLPSKDIVWYDFWTNEKFMGGQTYQVSAEIDQIPLFIKGGSIIPTQRKVQHSLENCSEYTVLLFDSGYGEFTFYNDDGVSYNYEKGDFDKVNFKWTASDHSGKLMITVDARQNNDPLTFQLKFLDKTKIIEIVDENMEVYF